MWGCPRPDFVCPGHHGSPQVFKDNPEYELFRLPSYEQCYLLNAGVVNFIDSLFLLTPFPTKTAAHTAQFFGEKRDVGIVASLYSQIEELLDPNWQE